MENTNNHNSSGTSTNLDLLLLLLDSAELISDGRAVLAIMAIENLLYLQDTLAPELVFASLLGLLGA